MLNRASGSASNGASAESNEEQTSEMISNLTMTQLLYILQRIQQLCFHSQEHAKKLLSESPQLALALIHAQYVVAGKQQSESSLLPLTSEEVKLAKDRIAQIRLLETNPTASVNLIGNISGTAQDVGLSRKLHVQQSAQSNDQAAELSRLLTGLDPSVLEKVMQGVTGGDGKVSDLSSMVHILMNLSAEQIALLPESLQRQVLKLLEESLVV